MSNEKLNNTKQKLLTLQESIALEDWEFDITSERKWARNSKTNSYIHGDFVLDFLRKEAQEIISSRFHNEDSVAKVKTLQEQLDKFKLKLLKTNPVIIQHDDGSLSQGNAAEWLLQNILKVENW
tara:strand:+ start:111 stop:482 length:372 start_codon:yes stop_codon:yes gene_type:complete